MHYKIFTFLVMYLSTGTYNAYGMESDPYYGKFKEAQLVMTPSGPKELHYDEITLPNPFKNEAINLKFRKLLLSHLPGKLHICPIILKRIRDDNHEMDPAAKKLSQSCTSKLYLFKGPDSAGLCLKAQAIAEECGYTFIHYYAPSLRGPYQNSELTHLTQIIDPLIKKKEPVVLCFEHLKGLVYYHNSTEPIGPLNSYFKFLIESIKEHHHIILICTASENFNLPPRLYCFFRQFNFNDPERTERYDIASYYNEHYNYSLSSEEIKKLSEEYYGLCYENYKNVFMELTWKAMDTKITLEDVIEKYKQRGAHQAIIPWIKNILLKIRQRCTPHTSISLYVQNAWAYVLSLKRRILPS